ncbi:CHAT domain-containing protein [Hyphomicrobium sp.]|uniref:CHAT domain-containing protein n=1 Tax=Hyphomicrobium sp. TaxID=82 RepID=UPI0025BCF31D|nr:CHAT domain-containing protein [Hyphomicrobium sp.]MCC7254005.1 CHAT domain-containing protein [Hyphomicrobium sp.]
MRRAFACVMAAVWLVATAPLVPEGFAQQNGAADPLKAAEFVDVYRRWQQAQDPEQKIALGEQALALEPALTSWPLDTPRDGVRGELWFDVGSAYFSRASGVRADNLEKAVAYLESALAVFTREADPMNWAAAKNNLGGAYQARIRGERADNQERAIAHFEAALTVITHEAYPLQWAQLQNNLGVVNWNRIRGERAENIETAIKHFEATLTVFTRDAHAHLWAAVQNNLGSAYQARIRGERADNREKALQHLEAVLTVFTPEATPHEWAQAQNNLAAVYLERIRGERAENQEKSIAHLTSALTVFTRETSPQEWATVQRVVGDVHAERIRGDHASNRERSIAAYEAALSIFTRETSPLDHLRTARRLSRVLLKARQWSKAGVTLAGARETFLLLFGQGLEDAQSRALVAEAGPMFADAAYAAVERGEKEAAVQLASEGRARLLAVAMRLQSLDLPSEQRGRLDDLRAAIRGAEQAIATTHGADRGEALDRLISLRQELLRLVTGSGRTAETSSALAQAHAIIAPGSALTIPVVTELGTKLLVITKPSADAKSLAVVDIPELTTLRLAHLLIGPDDGPPAGWVDAYFVNYLDSAERRSRWSEWTDAIDKLGPDLWRLFGARLDAALKQEGVKPGARLVWLPSGWLGVLPLGLAQDPASKRRLADDYEIVYAPSLDALAAAQDLIAKASTPTLAAVINPTGDLPGTEKEGAFVASYFADNGRALLQRDAATPDAVLAALKGKSHWHFASHGTFSWQDARESALVMHGPAMLSVARLLETGGLGRPRLVVLSACETGLSDITTSPDEFIGLPGTFTALGAAGVIGTLWPVSDAATALLIAKFYELHMGGHLPPSTALHRAQTWLREATSADLNSYARVAATHGRLQSRHLTEIENALGPEGMKRSTDGAPVDQEKRHTQTPGVTGSIERLQSARPYAHPYFWGGFIHTGL